MKNLSPGAVVSEREADEFLPPSISLFMRKNKQWMNLIWWWIWTHIQYVPIYLWDGEIKLLNLPSVIIWLFARIDDELGFRILVKRFSVPWVKFSRVDLNLLLFEHKSNLDCSCWIRIMCLEDWVYGLSIFVPLYAPPSMIIPYGPFMLIPC